jgi:hypothetical protein
MSRTRLVALLSVPALALVGLTGCGDEEPTRPAGADSTQASDPATSDATEEPTADAPATTTVPVYFVGDTPQGPRLYREFQQVEADNPVDEALAILAAGAADDPDYSSLLPEGTPTLVQGDNSEAIGVNVPVEWADRPEGMSEAEAKLAVQQLVYTVQGVLQSRTPVEFFSDGLTPMFGIDQSSFKAAPQNKVLAFVNVTEPTEQAQVEDTFTASGVANSFEATVPWEIRDASGTTVQEGFATAEGWGDHLYPWQAPVDVSALAPGTYTFVATTDDASDGEGSGPTEDTKTIIVP